MTAFRSILVSIFLLTPMPVLAYIGPGSGISLLGGLWAVLAGFVLALAAILIWPIRYMIKRRRARKHAGQSAPAEKAAEDPARNPAMSSGNGESSK